MLENNEEIQFVLIGEGAYKEQVKEVSTRNNIKSSLISKAESFKIIQLP